MIGIERRAQRDVFAFTFIDPIRYVSLEYYCPLADGFARTVREQLPHDWVVHGSFGIWCEWIPPHGQLSDQGFKIHLSATCNNAVEVLKATVPIVVRHQVVFKHLADFRVLDFVNSQTMDRTACGKFVTIYPNSIGQFKLLMQELHLATRDLSGPYILSDKRYSQSKILFYRYGAFRNISRLNIFGEQERCLRNEKKELVPDQRQPYFILPEHVQDPFEEGPDDSDGALLNKHYRVTSILQASSKGGVYVAEDTRTGDEVVLKEARPWINFSRHNALDAVACLHHEYDVLKSLEDCGYTPKPIEIFCEWEHSFLVMEKVGGVPLTSYRAYEAFSIMLQTDYTDAELQIYCSKFLNIAEQLLDAVRAIHARGIVIRDLAPQNILIDPDNGKVNLLDLESAYYIAGRRDSPLIPIGTIGYTRMLNRNGATPQFGDDYYALSNIICDLLFPMTFVFHLNPGAKSKVLHYISREKGLPRELIELILHLREQAEGAEKLLHAARQASRTARVSAKPLAQSTDSTLKHVITQMVSYIGAQLQLADHSGLLPTDYRRYITNPLSVAYGYCGIAEFLHEVAGEIPLQLQQEIFNRSRKITTDDYAPGLYIGTSGIAWVMENLGWRSEGQRIMAMTATSGLVNKNADMFYGAAGWGLTNLYFYHRTGHEEYVNQAKRAADSIREQLQAAENGLFYENFGNVVFHGYGHGSSGIALFFLRLYQVTRTEYYLDTARRLLNYEIDAASANGNHLVWARSNKETFFHSPYQRIGSAGIASVLLRAYDVTGEGRYLDVAKRAALYLAGKLTVFPGQFSGTAGIGELFIDFYQYTGEEAYREEAFRFADRILLYAIKCSEGLVFPGDELMRVSTDFGTGSAGVGMFFHRVVNGGPRLFYDF